MVPDLEIAAREYIQGVDNKKKGASIAFLSTAWLGQRTRPRGLLNITKAAFGNSHHLWMWDVQSLAEELQQAGFNNIRACKYADSSDPVFKLVEDEGRFWHAAAIECIK